MCHQVAGDHQQEVELIRSEHEQSEKRRTLLLENLLPIQSTTDHTTSDIVTNIRNERHSRCALVNEWHCIPSLHGAVQRQLGGQTNFEGGKVEKVHIYTDGSKCREGAAWAYVVEIEVWKKEKTEKLLVGFNGAPLAIAETSEFHMGEKHEDALEAETMALWWAAIWLLAWEPSQLPQVVFHGDCLATLMSSSAEWKLPHRQGKISEMALKTRWLLQRIEADGMKAEYEHTKAHTGIIGNEAADSIANAIAHGRIMLPERRTLWAKTLAHHSDLPVLWLQGKNSMIPQSGQKLMERSLPTSEETKKQIMEAIGEEEQKRKGHKEIQFKIATINVFAAMDKEAGEFHSKRVAIAQQCHDMGWQVVAIQESRLRQSIIKADHHYWMFTSAATAGGHGGVEIWIHKQWRPGHAMITQKDIRVMECSTNYMVLTVKTSGFCADVIKCHAPQRTDPKKDIWWQKIKEIVRKRHEKGRLIFLVGDFNARVGQEFSEGIGDLDPVPECENGEWLRNIIDSCDLNAMNTFSSVHSGTTATFQRHRLDYLIVSRRWSPFMISTEVDQTIDMLHRKDDHRPVVGQCSYTIEREKAPTQPRLFDRKEAHRPESKEKIKMVMEQYQTPAWEVSGEDHVQDITNYLHEKLSDLFPCKKISRPLSPYLGEQLWKLVQDRKEIQQIIKHNKRQVDRANMQKCFMAWKTHQGGRQESATLWQIDALMHKALQDTGKLIRKKTKEDKQKFLQSEMERLEDAFRRKDVKKVYEAMKTFRPANAKNRIKTPKPLPCLRVQDEWVESYDEWAHAWHSHWARVECAEIIGHNTHLANIIDMPNNWKCTAEEIQEAMPTLAELEQIIHDAKKGKAPGQDQLTMEIFKADVPAAARIIFPVMAKELARGQVPAAHKGSLSIPLYKAKGDQCERTSYRAISLQPTMGKIIARAWRPDIVKAFKNMSTPLQGGAKCGLGPVSHVTRIRALQRLVKCQNQSFGLVVMDIESAFYKTLRHLLVRRESEELSEEFLAFIFQTFDLPPMMLDCFREAVNERPILEEGGMKPAVLRVIYEGMKGSWARIPLAKEVLVARTGTKPGDPIADVLFSCVMCRFLERVTVRLRDTFGAEFKDWPMTWVDDIALPFREQAQELHTKATEILKILVEEAQMMAMIPSLQRGKTEVLLTCGGKGSRQVKRGLEQEGNGICFKTKWGREYTVECVDELRYLGAIIDNQCSLTPEIKRMTSAAWASVKPLRRGVLQNDKIEKTQRKGIISVLAMSKAGYTVGSWPTLRNVEKNLWSKRIMQIYRSTYKWDPTAQEHVSNLEVLASMDCLHPQVVHEVAVIRQAMVLAKWSDETYMEPFFALDDWNDERSWTFMAVQTYNKMDALLHEIPTTCASFRELFDMMKDKRQGRRILKDVKRYEKKQYHIQRQAWDVQQKTGKSQANGKKESSDVFLCPVCDKEFTNATAVGVHKRVKHAIFAVASHYAPGTACFKCGVDFHTRSRLIQHLQYGTTSCLRELQTAIEPLTCQQVEDLNQRDRLSTREAKLTGRKIRAQKLTYLPEGWADVVDMTGEWLQEGVQPLDDDEIEEQKDLDDWVIESEFLSLFENFEQDGDDTLLLQTIDRKCAEITSPRILWSWMNTTERDLRNVIAERTFPGDTILQFVKIRRKWLSPKFS